MQKKLCGTKDSDKLGKQSSAQLIDKMLTLFKSKVSLSFDFDLELAFQGTATTVCFPIGVTKSMKM